MGRPRRGVAPDAFGGPHIDENELRSPRYLARSRCTMYQWRCSGKLLDPVKENPRRWSEPEVRAWIAADMPSAERWAQMREQQAPLVAGGQGKSPEELISSANLAIGALLLALGAMLMNGGGK